MSLVYLFEQTFGVKFINEFQQHKKTKAYKELLKWNADKDPDNSKGENHCRDDNTKKYCTRLGKIKEINNYDFLLYDYAKYVFFKRIQFFRKRELEEKLKNAVELNGNTSLKDTESGSPKNSTSEL